MCACLRAGDDGACAPSLHHRLRANRHTCTYTHAFMHAHIRTHTHTYTPPHTHIQMDVYSETCSSCARASPRHRRSLTTPASATQAADHPLRGRQGRRERQRSPTSKQREVRRSWSRRWASLPVIACLSKSFAPTDRTGACTHHAHRCYRTWTRLEQRRRRPTSTCRGGAGERPCRASRPAPVNEAFGFGCASRDDTRKGMTAARPAPASTTSETESAAPTASPLCSSLERSRRSC